MVELQRNRWSFWACPPINQREFQFERKESAQDQLLSMSDGQAKGICEIAPIEEQDRRATNRDIFARSAN
jgi:hypothetical protein